MTRGKEVQDFIKAEKKSARQRFEEAGWEFKEDNSREFSYWKNGSAIFFCNRWNKGVMAFNFINMETLKLINYQCEELGWCNE